MRGDDQPDRRVDARQFLDDDRVIDVAESRAAQLFRENDSEKAEFTALLDYLERKDLLLVPFEDVRRDLRLRKLADLFAELLLFLLNSKSMTYRRVPELPD